VQGDAATHGDAPLRSSPQLVASSEDSAKFRMELAVAVMCETPQQTVVDHYAVESATAVTEKLGVPDE